MSLSDILDETITDAAPTFDLNGLIARERRRVRIRRGGGLAAAVVTVAAILLSAQTLIGRDDAHPATTASPSTTRVETIEQRYNRMSQALLIRLAELAPGSTVTSHAQQPGTSFTDGRFVTLPETLPGYDSAWATLSFSTPTSGAVLEIGVLWPTAPGPRPTDGALFGGCAARNAEAAASQVPVEIDCTTEIGADGSIRTLGSLYRSNIRIHFASVVYLDGRAVGVAIQNNRPEGLPLTPEQVLAIATDPAFAS